MANSNSSKKQGGNSGGTHASIREQLFQDVGESKTIRRTLENGIEVEMREPTKGQRNKAIAESREEDTINPLDFMVRIAVRCAYVPDTNSRVFSDGDIKYINDLTNAPWVDELTDMAQEIVGMTREEMEKK